MRLATLLLGAAAAIAQQPAISNANLQTASAAGGLEAALRSAMTKQPGPAWIGYAIAKVPGDNYSCCWGDSGYGCGLEGQRSASTAAPAGPIKLEGPTHIAILFRADRGTIEKLRTFSVDCPLDAGGLPFHWLTNVSPASSVAELMKLALSPAGNPDIRRRIAQNAAHAIAMQAGAEAGAALERLAAAPNSMDIRRDALYGLAASRGAAGFEFVRRTLREDPDDKIREHAAYALTRSKEAGAIPAVIAAMKADRSAHVRGQAMFWLAQRAPAESLSAITEAVTKDPDPEGRKKALNALTRVPDGQGVPALLAAAQNSTDPAIRKQAMSLLGRSKDPRAMKYFEDVLTK